MRIHRSKAEEPNRLRSQITTLFAALVIASLDVVSVAAQGQRPPPPLPNFSGDWVEIKPDGARGPAMRLSVRQQGSHVEVSGDMSGQATIQSDRTATWDFALGCDQRFQRPGYNYDNPGSSHYTLRLEQHPGGRAGLVYTKTIERNVPCDGHEAGTEHTEKKLSKQS
jgi:hypothetical protein